MTIVTKVFAKEGKTLLPTDEFRSENASEAICWLMSLPTLQGYNAATLFTSLPNEEELYINGREYIVRTSQEG